MTPDTIFARAIAIDSADQRGAFLDDACGGDSALRRDVEGLVRDYFRAGDFLERPAGYIPSTIGEPVCERPGTVIGPYKLMEQIGEGGFGLVFVAEQQRPVHRRVALKVIKPGMDSRQIVARFEAERQALALMDHPNIARVFDAGATASGRPYFVMELVKGVPINTFCDAGRLTTRERLALFVSVCAAVQHAHQKGIIHRDLKPSNVLVMSHDGTPAIKVIDFGVSKAIGQQLTEKTVYTQFTQMVGTPLYMSPEQAGQSGLDVDTRTDIYALGVLLYELLTGTTPFDEDRLRAVGFDEMRRIIRDEEPAKPSTRISTLGPDAFTVSVNRQTDPRRLSRLCRGELDWIVMKALEKDRDRRYESASAFAADVERYLRDEPVQACPPSLGYRLGKFARKYRKVLATVAAFAALLMAASVGSIALASWAMRERNHAEVQKRSAEADFKRALESVDKMLTRVGEVQLAHVPQMELVRRNLLQDALRCYQDFLRERGENPVVRAEAAKAYRRVGQIQDLLGQRDEAEKAYGQAAALLETLAAGSPDDPFILYEQANVHRGLGLVYHATRRWPEAEKSLEKGVALLEQLERMHPELQSNRYDLAKAHGDLINLFRQMGKLDRGETAYLKSLAILDRLEADDSTNVNYLALRARCYLNVGLVYMAQGRMVDAEAVYQKAQILNQQLIRDQPDVVEHRRRLSSTFNNLGLLYARDGQNEKAEAAYKESLALKEAIHRDYPMVVSYKIELAGIYGNLATQIRMRSPEEALGWAGRSIGLLESVLEKDDRDVAARMGLFNDLMGRAYALGRLGRREEAAKDWRRVLEVSEGQPHINMRLYRPFAHLRLGEHARAAAESETVLADGHAQPPNLHLFASVYSLASAAALEDAHLPLIAREKRADQYGARAVELLQRARAGGLYRNKSQVADVQSHKDFDAIRSRPDFQTLVGELERETTPN